MGRKERETAGLAMEPDGQGPSDGVAVRGLERKGPTSEAKWEG